MSARLPLRAAVRSARWSAVRQALVHGAVAGVAALSLGIGLAGSRVSAGAAQQLDMAGRPANAAAPTAEQARFEDRARAADRISRRAGDRAAALAGRRLQEAVLARSLELDGEALATKKAAKAMKAAGLRPGARRDSTVADRPSPPVRSGYTVAARFGATGSWSRYHTGFDFSAPVGTPVVAAQSGVVTVAGSGPASGWAGTYVVVKHADGTSGLYAHMSDATVSVGDTVAAGARVGAVGLTGRTFGPHLHFEIYPAGARPGDVYAAVDPGPWFAKLGIRP